MLIYKRESIMSTIVFFHPSVDIDPIPTGAGGIVRGATITLTGRAACIKETIDTDTEEEETEDSPESIRKVEVRLRRVRGVRKGAADWAGEQHDATEDMDDVDHGPVDH